MKRQEILSAIAQRLQTITITNGYNSDIGQKVLYWQDLPSEYEADCVIYRDTRHEFAKKNLDFNHQLTCDLQAVLFSSEDASAALQDLITVVGNDDTWGKLATFSRLYMADIQLVTAGRRAIAVTLPVEIHYKTPLWEV